MDPPQILQSGPSSNRHFRGMETSPSTVELNYSEPPYDAVNDESRHQTRESKRYLVKIDDDIIFASKFLTLTITGIKNNKHFGKLNILAKHVQNKLLKKNSKMEESVETRVLGPHPTLEKKMKLNTEPFPILSC